MFFSLPLLLAAAFFLDNDYHLKKKKKIMMAIHDDHLHLTQPVTTTQQPKGAWVKGGERLVSIWGRECSTVSF